MDSGEEKRFTLVMATKLFRIDGPDAAALSFPIP